MKKITLFFLCFAYAAVHSALYAQPAKLWINEVSPKITGSADLVELIAVRAGSVQGFTLEQAIGTPVVLATLPAVNVSLGDMIVIHLNPTAAAGYAPGSETTSKTEYPYAMYSANYDNAWDFQGGATGITSTKRVLVIKDSSGVIQDANPFTDNLTAVASFYTDLQTIQGMNLWLPADCGGSPCTGVSTPTGDQVSVDWSGCGTTPFGNSVQRMYNQDNNLKSDWEPAASAETFGQLNPTQVFFFTSAYVISDVACNGGSNASASVTIAGGTAPYTYSWTPSGQTSQTATGLSAGTYTCVVMDASAYPTSSTITITEPAALISGIPASTDILCNGGNDGSAYISASGGTGSYSYQWAPSGGTSATASNLSANTYTATVTDANGCTTTSSVVITEPPQLTAVISSSTDVLCFGLTDGTANVLPGGGAGAYSYVWSPAGGSSSSATNLAAGNYTVSVTDANGCVTTTTVVINEPLPLMANISASTDASCISCSDGSAVVNAIGGTGAYTYSWTPSGGNAATASNLLPGTYTCCVADVHGCLTCTAVNINYPTGISEMTGAGSFIISPNPMHNLLNIESRGLGMQSAELKMFDITGRVVFEHTLSSERSTFTLQLSAGIYFIRLSSGKNTWTQKVMVE